MLKDVLRKIDERREQSLSGLIEFLRFPSVSAQPAHAADTAHCAQYLAERLQAADLSVEIHPTRGNPIVVARNVHRPDRPTVLFYGHYDVQPPEPLEEWVSPPFEPTIHNNAVTARGACDDKGQVWTSVEAVTVWQHMPGGLPVNLVMMIEGEEEVGSDNLELFVRTHHELLAADIAVISDTSQFARGVPAITYGLRGLVYTEVVVTGPDHDLHSGMYGGAVPNPANVLCQLLAGLHDADGRVMVPGFYDDVQPLAAAERAQWQSLPFDEAAFLNELKIPAGNGEAGFSTLERRWARPTCDINGLTSGYQGPGAKTIIPSKASAKVSMRLVPYQDPAKVMAGFEKFLRERAPSNVKLEILNHSGAGPVLVPHDGRAIGLAMEAIDIGFGARPKLIREGGSIPVVALFKKELSVDTLLVGFGLPDDRVHSPNEKFDLDALHQGTRAAAALYAKLATLKR